MSLKAHFYLLRTVRIISFLVGLGIIVQMILRVGNVIELNESAPILIGLAVMFFPHGVLIGLLPAECSSCGGRTYAEVKRHVVSNSKQDDRAGQIRCYVWKCENCKKIEKRDATWFDRLTSPSTQSSKDNS